MRHLKAGNRLSRTTSHREAMKRNMIASLFISENGRIKTTIAKAKETRKLAEKLITMAKDRASLHARRIVFSRLRDETALRRLFDEISPRFADREGGYTRIVKLPIKRQGDDASMCFLELVGETLAESRQRPKRGGNKAGTGRKKSKSKRESKPRGKKGDGADKPAEADTPADDGKGAEA
jgi:large subunit ribosomal protein L17